MRFENKVSVSMFIPQIVLHFELFLGHSHLAAFEEDGGPNKEIPDPQQPNICRSEQIPEI